MTTLRPWTDEVLPARISIKKCITDTLDKLVGIAKAENRVGQVCEIISGHGEYINRLLSDQAYHEAYMFADKLEGYFGPDLGVTYIKLKPVIAELITYYKIYIHLNKSSNTAFDQYLLHLLQSFPSPLDQKKLIHIRALIDAYTLVSNPSMESKALENPKKNYEHALGQEIKVLTENIKLAKREAKSLERKLDELATNIGITPLYKRLNEIGKAKLILAKSNELQCSLSDLEFLKGLEEEYYAKLMRVACSRDKEFKANDYKSQVQVCIEELNKVKLRISTLMNHKRMLYAELHPGKSLQPKPKEVPSPNFTTKATLPIDELEWQVEALIYQANSFFIEAKIDYPKHEQELVKLNEYLNLLKLRKNLCSDQLFYLSSHLSVKDLRTAFAHFPSTYEEENALWVKITSHLDSCKKHLRSTIDMHRVKLLFEGEVGFALTIQTLKDFVMYLFERKKPVTLESKTYIEEFNSQLTAWIRSSCADELSEQDKIQQLKTKLMAIQLSDEEISTIYSALNAISQLRKLNLIYNNYNEMCRPHIFVQLRDSFLSSEAGFFGNAKIRFEEIAIWAEYKQNEIKEKMKANEEQKASIAAKSSSKDEIPTHVQVDFAPHLPSIPVIPPSEKLWKAFKPLMGRIAIGLATAVVGVCLLSFFGIGLGLCCAGLSYLGYQCYKGLKKYQEPYAPMTKYYELPDSFVAGKNPEYDLEQTENSKNGHVVELTNFAVNRRLPLKFNTDVPRVASNQPLSSSVVDEPVVLDYVQSNESSPTITKGTQLTVN